MSSQKSDLWDYLGGDNGDWGDIEEIKRPGDQDPFSDLSSSSQKQQPGQAGAPADEIFTSMDAFEASDRPDKAPKGDPFKSFGL